MNYHQNEKYSVFLQIFLFLAAYVESFAGNTQLLTAIERFKGLVTKIDDVSAKKQPKATVPKTKMKTTARKSVVSQIEAACLLALEWAKSQKNEQLIKDFTIYKSDFRGKINAMMQLAKYTYGVLNANKTAIIAATSITALQLTDIENAIELLHTLQQAPSATRNAQRTVTALYIPAFLDASAGEETIVNLINGAYTIGEHANLQLITDLANSLVFGGNVQHTILKAVFLQAGTSNAIEGGIMTITELKRVGRSNIQGVAQIAEFVPGTYHIVLSAIGYEPQTHIKTIAAGEKMNFTVQMEEVVVSG